MKPSFVEIEVMNGFKWNPIDDPLDSWYGHVRHMPISQLEIADVCRAVRQDVWAEHILPEAVERLSHDLLAGDLYDGELLASLAGRGSVTWSKHEDVARELEELIARANPEQLDDDQRESLSRLQRQIALRHVLPPLKGEMQQ